MVLRRWGGWFWLAAFALAGNAAQAAEPVPERLAPEQLKTMLERKEDLILVNTMSRIECLDHSIPGSVCVAAEEFSSQASRLLPDKNRRLVFYCESNLCNRSEETAARAATQQGYRRVAVLEGGMQAWKKAGYGTVSRERTPRVPVESVKPERLEQWLKERKDLLILDVRQSERFQEGHLPNAINIPLYRLHERYHELPLNRLLLVVDDMGLRSFLASSYLVRKGIPNVKRLFGGMERWQAYQETKRGKR